MQAPVAAQSVASAGLQLVRQGAAEKSAEGSGTDGKPAKWNKRYVVILEGISGFGGIGSALRIYQSRPKAADATLRPSDSGLIKYEMALHNLVQIASSGDPDEPKKKKKKGGKKKRHGKKKIKRKDTPGHTELEEDGAELPKTGGEKDSDSSGGSSSASENDGEGEQHGQASPRLIRQAKAVFGPTSVIVRDPVKKDAAIMLRFENETERDAWVRDLRKVIAGTVVAPNPAVPRPLLSGISRQPGLRMEGFVEKPGKLKARQWTRRYAAVIGDKLLLYQHRPFTPAEVEKKWGSYLTITHLSDVFVFVFHSSKANTSGFFLTAKDDQLYEGQSSGGMSTEPKYQVALSQTTQITPNESNGFCFVIRDERIDVNIELRCPSPQERHAWLVALNDACGRKRISASSQTAQTAQTAAPPNYAQATTTSNTPPGYQQATTGVMQQQQQPGMQQPRVMQQQLQQQQPPAGMMGYAAAPQVSYQYVMTPYGMQMQPVMAAPQMSPQMAPQMAPQMMVPGMAMQQQVPPMANRQPMQAPQQQPMQAAPSYEQAASLPSAQGPNTNPFN
jgi:PH domain